MNSPTPSLCLATLAALALPACGGGGGGGGSAPPPVGTDPVANTLNTLGVDTSQTPRETDAGIEVDDNYSPFGKTWKLASTHELLVVGPELDLAGNDPLALVNVKTDTEMFSVSETGTPWQDDGGGGVFTFAPLTRAAFGADLDADGLEEGIVVYQQGIETRIWTMTATPGGPFVEDVQIDAVMNVTHLTATCGDLDGDGFAELVIARTTNRDTGALSVWTRRNGFFEQLGETGTFTRTTPNGDLWFRLATGDIDRDSRDEIAVVANSTVGDDQASCRYRVFDDIAEGLTELAADAVAATNENGQVVSCLTADVSIGDIDGDSAGEIVLGGITELPPGGNCRPANYFAFVLDDLARGLVERQGREFRTLWTGCNSPERPDVLFAFVGTFDVDGDGLAEIHVNEHVFDDFANAAPWTKPAHLQLPIALIYDRQDFGRFNVNNADIRCADFDGDDRDDIVVCRMEEPIRIWGYGEIDSQIEQFREYDCNFYNAQNTRFSLAAPVNFEADGPVLAYSDAAYKLVYTEPIPLAVLAAPPCIAGVNPGCQTSFGNTTSSSRESERSVTVSVSASVGVKVDGGFLTQSEFELKDTATASSTRVRSSAYSLSKTVIFTSGEDEDTVVFTTVPVDQYTYTVLSHPDPAMVGKEIVISLPREPVTIQAERGFYNEAVPDAADRIDERVFQHVPGDIDSYPTRARKNQIQQQRGGLQSSLQGVGQGGTGSANTVQIAVGNTIGTGGALALGYERSFQGTVGGVLAGISVGVEATRSFRITSGSETTYTGTVAQPAAGNADYRWGMFTYVFEDSVGEREFQVINYWVE